MRYERLWERLLEFLNIWATAREVEPGRIEITLADAGHPPRTIEIVMTRREWSDLVTIPFGDFDQAARSVQEAVLGLAPDEEYLVYRTYELVPSRTPDLPEDSEETRLRELARQQPGGFGRWVVLDDEGNVVDELGPPSE